MAKINFFEPHLHTRELFPEIKAVKDRSLWLKLILAFFGGFFFSCFKALDGFSPFGVCFCVGVPFEFCFAAFFGSITGYCVSLSLGNALRYSGALIVCCLLRFLLKKHLPSQQKSAVTSSISAVSLLISGTLYLFAAGMTLRSILLLTAETVLGFIFSIILIKALSSPLFLPFRGTLRAKDTLSLITVGCIFLLSGCGLTFNGFSLVRTAAFTAVLFFSYCKGVSAGSVSGICIGGVLSLSPGFGTAFPVFAVGGLVSGTVSSYGQLISAAAFFVSGVVSALLCGIDREFFIIIAEALAGCLAFTLIPPSYLDTLLDSVKKRGIIKDEKAETQVSSSLRTAAHNVYKVCDIISNVSDRLEKQNEEAESSDPLFQMKLYEMRRLLTDQFCGVGDFLYEFANQVSTARIHDPSRSAALRSTLKEAGIHVDSLSYFTNKDGAVTIEMILIDRPFDINWKKAGNIIELITKRSFDRPEVTVNELSAVLTYTQKLPYRLQIGCAQRSAEEGNVCGDSVSIAAKVESRGFALISDGMGTGPRAAIDSTMTASVMKKLLCSGFSFDSALKIINSALIVRGQEESIASIDAIETNLFTGETVFYKAGATYSLLRKGGRTVTLEKASLPLGILRNISFSKTKFTASEGDIILLFSDGVTQGDWGWVNDELLSWSTNNMEDLSMHILRLASLRQEKATADDMTVVAVKVEKNK